MKKNIKLTEYDNFTLIKFSKPPANTFCIDFLSILIENLNKIEKTKALVLTGEGTIFSAGLDLFYIEKLSKNDFIDLISLFEKFIYKIIKFPLPTYAILNGHAIAGGFILASSTDTCISNNIDYKIGLNENLLNFSLPAIPSAILKLKYKKDINDFYSTKPISSFIKINKYIKINNQPLEFIKNQFNNFDQVFFKNKKNNIKKLNNYVNKYGRQHNIDFFNSWWSDKNILSREKYIAGLKSKK